MKLREEVGRVLQGIDLANTTLGKVRKTIEANLELESGALDEHKEYVVSLLQEKIQQMQEKTSKREQKDDCSEARAALTAALAAVQSADVSAKATAALTAAVAQAEAAGVEA